MPQSFDWCQLRMRYWIVSQFQSATHQYLKLNTDPVDKKPLQWRNLHRWRIVIQLFDYHQNLVGTTETVNFTDLPAKGQQEINKRYADFKIGQVIFFDDNEWNETDMIMYGSQFNDADNYFVELSKGNDKIVVRVDVPGYVYYFTKL